MQPLITTTNTQRQGSDYMWIEKRDNGTFRAIERYKDPMSGRQKRVSVVMEKDTKSSRKKAMAQLQQLIKEKMYTTNPTDNLTIKELCDLYQAETSRILKKSTSRRNFFVCQKSCEIWGSDVLVNKLNQVYIKKKLLETDMTPKQMNSAMKRFKIILNWGYDNDYVSDLSWMRKLKRFKEDVPHEISIKEKYLEEFEVKQIMDKMDLDVWKYTTAFLVLTGLRFGEYCALNVDDVNIEERWISITKTFDANNMITTSPKTLTSVRKISIQDELIEVIDKLTEIMNGYRDIGVESDLFVFKPDGDNLAYYTYRKYLKSVAKEAIERDIIVTPHVLRHTSASLMFGKARLSLDEVAERLGHSDSEITRRIYVHMTQERRESYNKALNSINLL